VAHRPEAQDSGYEQVCRSGPSLWQHFKELLHALPVLGAVLGTISVAADLGAVRLRPDLLEAQRSLALLAMRQGDMRALEPAANQIIRLQPASPDGYALHALSYINRRQFTAADGDIRKAIEVDPRSHLGYVQRGNLRFIQKQYADAAQAYREALVRDSNSTDALRGLMNSYLARNQVEKAVTAANAQIAMAPANSSF